MDKGEPQGAASEAKTLAQRAVAMDPGREQGGAWNCTGADWPWKTHPWDSADSGEFKSWGHSPSYPSCHMGVVIITPCIDQLFVGPALTRWQFPKKGDHEGLPAGHLCRCWAMSSSAPRGHLGGMESVPTWLRPCKLWFVSNRWPTSCHS